MTAQPPKQLTAFHPDYAAPPDTSSQVERWPGTPDADCMCGKQTCEWPYSTECWANRTERKDNA